MRRYDPLVFAAFVSLCVLGFVSLGIASSLPQYQIVDQVSSAIGGTLLIAAMILVLIAGWKGFLTLNGGSIGAACLMASVFCLAQCT
jgi:hypothetical protein